MNLCGRMREQFEGMQRKYPQGKQRAKVYRDVIVPQFPALFHKWFLLKFTDPTAWFEARCVLSWNKPVDTCATPEIPPLFCGMFLLFMAVIHCGC